MRAFRLVTVIALAIALVGGTHIVSPSAGAGEMPGDTMMSKTGDLNYDGTANSLDALLLLFYDAGMGEPPDDIETWTVMADVDCDFEVTALDAALILQAGAGMYELRA